MFVQDFSSPSISTPAPARKAKISKPSAPVMPKRRAMRPTALERDHRMPGHADARALLRDPGNLHGLLFWQDQADAYWHRLQVRWYGWATLGITDDGVKRTIMAVLKGDVVWIDRRDGKRDQARRTHWTGGIGSTEYIPTASDVFAAIATGMVRWNSVNVLEPTQLGKRVAHEKAVWALAQNRVRRRCVSAQHLGG